MQVQELLAQLGAPPDAKGGLGTTKEAAAGSDWTPEMSVQRAAAVRDALPAATRQVVCPPLVHLTVVCPPPLPSLRRCATPSPGRWRRCRRSSSA